MQGPGSMNSDVQIGTGSDTRLSAIRSRLKRREAFKGGLAVLSVICGLPLTLPGPLFFATVAWWVAHSLTRQWYPWKWIFLATCAVIVPLLFWTELRTQGRYIQDALLETSDSTRSLFNLFSNTAATALFGRVILLGMARPSLVPKSIVRVFLFGPRLVLDGARHLLQALRVGLTDMNRIAEVVQDLLSKGKGLAPFELLKPGERLEDLAPAIAWLAYYGWIGLGENTDRVFLYTETKKAFED